MIKIMTGSTGRTRNDTIVVKKDIQRHIAQILKKIKKMIIRGQRVLVVERT